jgi:hypothetical protein
MGDPKPAAKKPPPPPPPPPAYAPPSLSVRVQCTNKHPMTGLFVILRIAVAGPPHPTDKVVDVANAPVPGREKDKKLDPPTAPPDPSLLAQFVCTVVDGFGFLQPVTVKNPWHWLWGHDPLLPGKPAPRRGVAPKSADVARVSVDPDAKYVGCLLRHPQPNVARALTVWLNTGQDPEGHGFANWKKARGARLAGETSFDGRELLARELAIAAESSKGTQLVLTVSEDAADFLPPKFDAHGGWLLYYDMPHASCPPVVDAVTTLQKRLGLLRFPTGGEGNAYAPVEPNKGESNVNIGKFDARTLSGVRTFQEHAKRGEAFRPAAWPDKHDESSDGRHDWWFAIGDDTTVKKLDGPLVEGCCDEKTWAAIDQWIGGKVCKRAVVLVRNPSTYMRTDAALAVIAWKKIAEAFGVAYPHLGERSPLSSGYSFADYESRMDLTLANPHKTGFALDFSVVTDEVNVGDTDVKKGFSVSDFAHPRADWPILFEGQWYLEHAIDYTSNPKQALAGAKNTQKNAQQAKERASKTEAEAQKRVDKANEDVAKADQAAQDADAETDPKKAAAAAKAAAASKRKASASLVEATKARDHAAEVRKKADDDLQKANDGVDKAQQAVEDGKKKEEAAKTDPKHLSSAYNLACRLYGHSTIDYFAAADAAFDAAFDKLYKAIDGMAAERSAWLVKSLGSSYPAGVAKAYFDEQLKFFAAFEAELKGLIGPPDARNHDGRLKLRDKALRDSVRPWNANPYSYSGGSPGGPVRASADTADMDFENASTANTRNVPPGAKSFVNLSWLGWKCGMWRISVGPGRDPRQYSEKSPPRQTMYPMPTVFGHVVGLVDRLRRDDSEEKTSPIVCGSVTHTVDQLDVEFMLRWAHALPAMRPDRKKLGGTPVLVTTNSPQVTLQLTATDEGMAQLKNVFAKLDENGANQFVLVDIGKDALLDAAIIAESAKPGIVVDDKGKFDTGKAWKTKLENVATLFKEKVATVNVPPADKTPAANRKPVPSQRRDSRDLHITLQPVFEKVPPKSLDQVAFQPTQTCQMATPGHAEQLEWWHYQHQHAAGMAYRDMLSQIGYWPELLWRKREAPEQEQPQADAYNGRGVGGLAAQEKRVSYPTSCGEIENGGVDVRSSF